MELDARIRRARTSRLYSQKELAMRLGVGRSAVANWECGMKAPTSQRLQHLALITGVSYEWLATGRGRPELDEQWISAVQGEVVDDADELLVLRGFRACGAAGKRALLKSLSQLTSVARRQVYVAGDAVRQLSFRTLSNDTEAGGVGAGRNRLTRRA